MNDDFRQRVFLPIILPVGVIIGFFGFAWMLSRVLLAVAEVASTVIALGLAAYILGVTALIAARPRITSRALAVGVTLGVLSVGVAGTVAAAAGMREIHHEGEEEHGVESGDPASSPGGEEAAENAAAPDDLLAFTAIDIEFAEAPEQAVPAGEKTLVLVNDGATVHNVTIPELGDAPVVEAGGGETAEDIVELEPGSYEYFCSVPGHESLMRGEFTVE